MSIVLAIAGLFFGLILGELIWVVMLVRYGDRMDRTADRIIDWMERRFK